MHIISGKFKRQKLEYPHDRSFRPTKGIVRESLFNKIGDRIIGAVFLDLCSGTGAMAFEAESRGATAIISVDHYVEYIRRNAKKLHSSAQIYQSDVLDYLKQSPTIPVDFIYFDPVWLDMAIYHQGVELMMKYGWVQNDTWLIIEHETSTQLPIWTGMTVRDSCTFGRTRMSIFTLK